MATVKYTVKKGDTLWAISQKYNTTVSNLVKLNNITNPDFIVVGQVLIISGTPSTSTSTVTSTATIKAFGLQSNTDRTVYATWTWNKSNTEHYRVVWEYDTGDGVWFVGSDSTVTVKQSTYNGPTNANRVRFKVKPISKKHTVNKKETSYWTAGWSTVQIYNYSSNPPSVPSVPTVVLNNLTLTASLENIDSNSNAIQFEIYKDDVKFKSAKVTIKAASASYSCAVTAGGQYKVRCRSSKSNMYSDWTAYSSVYNTIPATPKGIIKCEAQAVVISDEDDEAEPTGSIKVEWYPVANADKYTIQYTDDKSLFDVTNDVSSVTTTDNKTTWLLTNLSSGKEWFIRVRAENSIGNSGWTDIRSAILGTTPSAPTTWSSTNTAMVGEDLFLYWIHNTQDNSEQKKAEIELYVDGVKQPTISQEYNDEPVVTNPNNNTNNNGENINVNNLRKSYLIDTSSYTEGTVIQWRVRTAGAVDQFGEWSVQRTVYVYAQPTLQLSVTKPNGGLFEVSVTYRVDRIENEDGTISYISTEEEIKMASGNIQTGILTNTGAQVYLGLTNDEIEEYYYKVDIDRLESFPFLVSTQTSPSTQEPIGFHLTIVANETYETTDNVGNNKIVSAGDIVYSKNFDNSEQLSFEVLPGHVSLENNISYTIKCTVSMNSGLTASDSYEFVVAWANNIIQYEPNAEISIDENTYSATIRPYCENDNGEPINDVTLSVYRREFDGSFTEIMTDIDGSSNTFITDPHPALDFARYRIVAKYNTTGAIAFCDIPGYPVGCKSIIIQWEETWSNFDSLSEDALEQPEWSGSMLKLPYNIDISDKNSIDVSLIEYIGRSHPVSYYGTQLGETSTWDVEINKNDKETLYALRRLSKWRGDVYVREPSGSGYWANVIVSFSQKHLELTIPVKISLVRVEGGI